jgi:Ca2+-transporting ATPase
MSRRPRPVSAPVLTHTQWIRVSITGLLIAIGALVAQVIGEDAYDAAVGTTMLLVTISVLHVVAALAVRDEYGTIFSRESVPGASQLRLYGLTILLAVLVTEIGFLQRIFDTVSLSFNQWLICLVLALVLLAYEEAAKYWLRRQMAKATPAASASSGLTIVTGQGTDTESSIPRAA